eukprot:6488935-Amphidinium_carterae.1
MVCGVWGRGFDSQFLIEAASSDTQVQQKAPENRRRRELKRAEKWPEQEAAQDGAEDEEFVLENNAKKSREEIVHKLVKGIFPETE